MDFWGYFVGMIVMLGMLGCMLEAQLTKITKELKRIADAFKEED